MLSPEFDTFGDMGRCQTRFSGGRGAGTGRAGGPLEELGDLAGRRGAPVPGIPAPHRRVALPARKFAEFPLEPRLEFGRPRTPAPAHLPLAVEEDRDRDRSSPVRQVAVPYLREGVPRHDPELRRRMGLDEARDHRKRIHRVAAPVVGQDEEPPGSPAPADPVEVLPADGGPPGDRPPELGGGPDLLEEPPEAHARLVCRHVRRHFPPPPSLDRQVRAPDRRGVSGVAR